MEYSNTYLLIFVIYTAVVCNNAAVTYIFGADPSGGLWGGSVDTDTGANLGDLQSAGYPNMDRPIGTSSYDPVSQQVLLNMYDPHVLAFGPLCSDTSQEPQYLANLTAEPVQDPILGDCLNCRTTGFAMYDSKVYFIFSGEWFNEAGIITRQVQIRTFDPCEACIAGPDGFIPEGHSRWATLFNCSHVVANVIDKSFTTDNLDNTELKPADNLLIINEAGTMSFAFQIFNNTGGDEGSDVSMHLYHVTGEGEVSLLRQESIDSRYYNMDIRASGGVDYNNGILCWTSMDRISCGDYSLAQKRLNNVTPLLTPGGTVVHEVCKGPESSVLTFVTGISIVEATAERRLLVFGCYGQSSDNGGAGVIGAGANWNQAMIMPLVPGDNNAKSGSIFHLDSLPQTCSFDPRPRVCLLKDPNAETEAPTKGVITSKPGPVSGGDGQDQEVSTEEEGNGSQKPNPPKPATDDNNSAGVAVHSFAVTLLCLLICL